MAEAAGAPSSSRAFASADFRKLQTARFTSIVGIQAQGVAIAWEVFSRTHHAIDLGYVGLAQFVPIAGLSLIAGHAADRLDRRRVLTAVHAASAVLSLVLFAYVRTGRAALWPIYAVLFCLGVARAFGQPAGAALLPDVVPAAAFENAVAWSSSLWQVAAIAGPALGGVLFTAVGGRAVYVMCAVLCAMAGASVARIRSTPARMSGRGASGEAVLAGVRYVWAHPIILGSISLDLFAVLLGGAVALLPMFADLLHVGAWGLGLLRSAPGLGAAVTGAWMAARPLRRRAGAWMYACVLGFGLATVGFALSNQFALSIILLFLSGVTDMVSVVIRQTLLQARTPPEMRGRVSAVNLVFVGASNELGEFESGVTGQWLGPRLAVLVGGVGTCLVVGVWAFLFPELRKVDRLMDDG